MNSAAVQDGVMLKKVVTIMVIYSEEPAAKKAETLSDLGLSQRSENVLRNMGITSIEGLCRVSYRDLLHKNGLGIVSVVEIHRAVEKAGYIMKEIHGLERAVEIYNKNYPKKQITL